MPAVRKTGAQRDHREQDQALSTDQARDAPQPALPRRRIKCTHVQVIDNPVDYQRFAAHDPDLVARRPLGLCCSGLSLASLSFPNA